jgi:hypothetical protein
MRAPQPEGNLFRDRFVSMQHRALIEPRAPVMCVALVLPRLLHLLIWCALQPVAPREDEDLREARFQAVRVGIVRRSRRAFCRGWPCRDHRSQPSLRCRSALLLYTADALLLTLAIAKSVSILEWGMTS